MNQNKTAAMTSMCGAIRSLIPADVHVIRAEVVEENPLKVRDLQNPKLTLTGEILVVPQWLSDFELKVEIVADTDYVYKEDAAHSYKADSMKITNHPEVGDILILLEIGGDRKYLVIDKEAAIS